MTGETATPAPGLCHTAQEMQDAGAGPLAPAVYVEAAWEKRHLTQPFWLAHACLRLTVNSDSNILVRPP